MPYSKRFSFEEHRINGFKLFGMAENGIKLLIYSDQPPYHNCREIILDSTYMPDVNVRVITIEGPEDTEKILTLCEVYVYGKHVLLIIINYIDSIYPSELEIKDSTESAHLFHT